MSESKFGPAAFSQGDVMRQFREIKRDIKTLQTSRRLESAMIGAGGLRILGGLLRVQDIEGDDMFRAGGDPGEVFIRDDILGPFAARALSTRTHTARISDAGSRAAAGFGDLDSGGAGPIVENVDVQSGVALVFVTCWIECALSQPTSVTSQTGAAGVRVSGATTRAPELIESQFLRYRNSTSGNVSDVTTGATALIIFDDLTPGTHDFKLEYSRSDSQNPALVTFAERRLAVIAL